MMAGALCEKDDFMKIMKWQKKLAVVLVGGLMVLALNAPAQNSPTAAPKLSYGVSEVVRLAQANINDDTIIAYIKSTRTDYKLSADQMLYLRQQGVSEAVIKAMLVQPKPVAAPATTPAAVASTAPAPAAPVPEATGRAAMSPTYTTPPFLTRWSWRRRSLMCNPPRHLTIITRPTITRHIRITAGGFRRWRCLSVGAGMVATDAEPHNLWRAGLMSGSTLVIRPLMSQPCGLTA